MEDMGIHYQTMASEDTEDLAFAAAVNSEECRSVKLLHLPVVMS
jgi:hypothetical protein